MSGEPGGAIALEPSVMGTGLGYTPLSLSLINRRAVQRRVSGPRGPGPSATLREEKGSGEPEPHRARSAAAARPCGRAVRSRDPGHAPRAPAGRRCAPGFRPRAARPGGGAREQDIPRVPAVGAGRPRPGPSGLHTGAFTRSDQNSCTSR